jgi:hypothetical protein
MSSLHVLVQLDGARPSVEGRVLEDDESPGIPFNGWLELMQIVEGRLVGGPAASPGPRAEHE